MFTSADVYVRFLLRTISEYEGGTKTVPPQKQNIYHGIAVEFCVRFCFQKNRSFFQLQVKSGGADMRVKITLACTECKQRNYDTMKNKKNDPDRLEMNKYCKFCRKHTLHRETK